MAKRKKASFVKGMVIYAVIFLVIAAASLAVFWDFIDAYECSRPKNTMDSYVSALTVEDMVESAGEMTAQLDGKLQSEEALISVIRDSLGSKITYARKSAACTESSQTYVLRSGSQVIGDVVITAGEPDLYGFSVWEVTSDRFDFSHLLCQEQSVTVPQTYTVRANGVVLDNGYITESGIRYSALEEFYDDYESLPCMVTYTADSVLGKLTLEITDEAGNIVENWEEFDPNGVLDNCDQDEYAMLGRFMNDFLVSYVRFTGSSNQAASLNYVKLMKQFLIPDSELAQRLYTALDGLAFAQSYNDKLDEVVVHRFSRIDDAHYFCDVTYLVSTYGKAGRVQTENNMKVMLVQWEDGLRVETMTRY